MLYIYWFRKDLRLFDNNALSQYINTLKDDDKILFIYIKNKNSFEYYGEKRISFLYESLFELQAGLEKYGIRLNILKGKSTDIFKKLIHKYGQLKIFANEQTEPYCIKRDNSIKKLLEKNSSEFISFNDTTLLDFNKIVTNASLPYTVFTPYRNKFMKILSAKDWSEYKVNLTSLKSKKQVSLEGFENYNTEKEYKTLDKSTFFKGGRHNGIYMLNKFIKENINDYDVNRDYPALNSTSLISPHLHFGTINIRECFRAFSGLKITNGIEKWRDELIWREFYYNIVYNYPYVQESSFKKDFDKLNWKYDKDVFSLWCEGNTGFPIIDAGMRQLKQEGWMHNRLRMITAMFLTKDLLIDWKIGEKYFAEKLVDMDFASNNGGWQWSASTGCDAQPYFRIFNPYLQSKKYDPDGLYIKKYVTELQNVPKKYIHNPSELPLTEQERCCIIIGKDYPAPIVNHSVASKIAIEIFKNVSKKFHKFK